MGAFKDMLKYLRSRSGLSQQELADKLGLGKSTISMYEVGKREPDFETLEKIADFFNVDMNFLLGKTSDEPDQYYFDDEAREMAQFMYDNPDYKVLFDASRKVKKEDLELVLKLIDKFKDENL